MTTVWKRLLAGAAVAAAAMAIATPARAEALPFTDKSTSATIGFCDRNGAAVTSGSIADRPFTWIGVSSAAAPEGYTVKGSRSTLYAFQPRENVDPSQWSGKQLTAASTYTNPQHPMTAGTLMDAAMVDFTSIAPLWQGLVQVRMYFTSPNTPQHSRPYPAAVIRVTGDKWTLVSGDAKPDCKAGSSVSAEVNVLPSTKLFGAPAPVTGVPKPSSASTATSGGAGTPSAGAAAGSADSDPSGGAPSNEASKNSSSDSVPVAAIAGSVGGVIVLAGLGGFLLWRRQSSTS